MLVKVGCLEIQQELERICSKSVAMVSRTSDVEHGDVILFFGRLPIAWWL